MLNYFRKKVRQSSIYPSLEWLRHNLDLFIWYKNGCPIPPLHFYKQRVVSYYAKRFRLKTLVETGTYKGDMIEAQKKNFSQIYSIELSTEHAKFCQTKFRKLSHVHIYQGDSADVLPMFIKKIKEPALFFLDGHFSAGDTVKGNKNTPVLEELNSILQGTNDYVVIIDDARCFVGKDDYPTLEEIERLVREKAPRKNFEVKHDLIRIS